MAGTGGPYLEIGAVPDIKIAEDATICQRYKRLKGPFYLSQPNVKPSELREVSKTIQAPSG